MPRERLPAFRHQITDSAARWPSPGGRRLHISIGLSDDGRPLEVFARGGGRTGTDLDFLLDDAAILVSRALQHGDQLADIARGVSRLPDGKPSSVIGALIDKAREIEMDLQDALAQVQAETQEPGP
jgi:hypothetical protein